MFPEEIVQILEKYKQENESNIQNINKKINTIITEIKIINLSIANQLRKLAIDENTNNNAEELLKDTITLRDYINSIASFELKGTQIDNDAVTSEEPTLIFDGRVSLYLISDDLCPFCNVKVHPHIIHYQRNLNNQLLNENIEWHKCPNCNKLFALDCDAEDFDFENTNILLKKDKYDIIPLINIYSVIVLNNTIQCTSNHKTKDLIANIPAINENGDLVYYKINASYCFDCERFTILKDDFNAIKDVIICKIIDETSDGQIGNYDLELGLGQKSILFNYGYNVQAKKNLSDKQRRIILSSVIEANIMNRRDIINHITTLIERGSKISSWREATQKWKDDKNFISTYKRDYLPEIVFDNIILKYKKPLLH